MIARVAVAHPGAALTEPLDYRIPEPLVGRIGVGTLVRVPLGNREARGLVVALAETSSWPAERLKSVRALEVGASVPAHLVDLLVWVADDTLTSLAQGVTAALPPPGRLGPLRYALRDGGSSTEGRRLAVAPAAPAGRGAAAEQRLTALLAEGPRTRAELLAQGVAESTLRRLLKAGRVVAVRDGGMAPDPWQGLDMHAPTSDGEVGPSAASPRVSASPAVAVPPGPALNEEQRRAATALSEALRTGAHAAYLLVGPTGSGKTEVYLTAMAQAVALGRSGIVLVPEIALTPQTVRRLRAWFGDRVAVLHSALRDSERHAAWQRLARGEARIAVGPRSAVWAPVRDLAMIVVDEEPDGAYVSEQRPHYDARRVAWERARREGAVYVAGSATPSLEALWQAAEGRMHRLDLTARPAGRTLPVVEVVDLRDRTVRPEGLLSLPLIAAIRDALGRGEQAVLLLNRRGYHPAYVCRDCGYTMRCDACDVALTFHQERGLLCHYCGRARPVPVVCPQCRGPRMAGLGAGTQRLVEEVARRFAGARVLRLDRDAAAQRGEAVRRIEAFANGEADVLVGTQMVAKGHDLPRVTVVGAVLADQGLTLPDHRAAERTAQLLAQVAGRAGRGDRPGRVLIQTYDPESPVIQAVVGHRYLDFAAAEMRRRAELGYPPGGLLAHIWVMGRDAARVDAAGEALAAAARELFGGAATVLGPMPPPVARVDHMARTALMIRAPRPAGAASEGAEQALRAQVKALLSTVRLPAGVRVDPWFEP